MASSTTTAVSTLNDSGTLVNLISYEFGYEVGTTNQNGETFLDGLNGNGYGIYLSGKAYNSLNLCSLIRYNYGVYFSGSNNVISTLTNANNNTYGVYFISSSNNVISTLTNANNNTNGVSFSSSSNNVISTLTNANNNTNYGVYFSSSSNNVISTLTNANNNTYGVYFSSSSNNRLKISSSTGGTGFYSDFGVNYFRESTFLQSSEFASVTTPVNNWVWSFDHDGTDGNHWGFTSQATVNLQSSVVHGTEPSSWKTAITGNTRTSVYRVKLPVGEFAGVASTNLTISAWVKKDHATNIACRLVCYADDALGITEQSATKANDTNWEQLSITLNSAHANPVFSVYLETWYEAGNSNSYLGAIEVS